MVVAATLTIASVNPDPTIRLLKWHLRDTSERRQLTPEDFPRIAVR